MSARSTSLYAVILLTAMALIPSAASAVSLLAYYEFEGNYNDSTTNGNNAAPGQNPTEVSIVAGGFRGQGADINDPAGSGGGNTGGSINIPINANPNESPEISFGGWVNLETNAGFPGFMAIDNGGWDRGIHLAGNSWEIASGGTTNVVVGAAPTGVWQYVVGTFSKPTNTATLYIGDNSAVQSTLSGSRADAGNNPGEVVIEIGRYDNQDLDARVDDIFVFDGALNAHQANAIRNLRLSGLDFSPAHAAELFDLFDANSSGTVNSYNWSPTTGLSTTNPGEIFDLGGGDWAVLLDSAGNGLLGHAELAKDVIAYWPFDADFDDHGPAGNINPGTPVGAPGLSGPAMLGSALQLDGGAQQVDVANESSFDFSGGGGFTMSTWARVSSFDTSWQALVAKGEGGEFRVHRQGGGQNLAFNAGGGGDLANAANVNDGEFHHIVAVHDPSNLTGGGNGNTLYIDGVPVFGARSDVVDNNQPLMIGENPDAPNREWEGQIDDMAFWGRPLSASDVATIYAAGQAGCSLGELFSNFGACDDTGVTDTDLVLSAVDPPTTSSLLANDIGDGLNVISSDPTSAQGAAVSVASDGTFTYDPTAVPALQALIPGQMLFDTFDYTIRDGGSEIDLLPADARFDSLTDDDSGGGGFAAGNPTGPENAAGLTFQVTFTPAAGDLDSSTAAVNLIEIGGDANGSGLYLLGGEVHFLSKMNGAVGNAPNAFDDLDLSSGNNMIGVKSSFGPLGAGTSYTVTAIFDPITDAVLDLAVQPSGGFKVVDHFDVVGRGTRTNWSGDDSATAFRANSPDVGNFGGANTVGGNAFSEAAMRGNPFEGIQGQALYWSAKGNFLSATATVTVKLNGVNDPPAVVGSGIPDQMINTSNPTLDVALFPYFEDPDSNHADTDLTYTVTMNTDMGLIQTSAISSVDGILTLDTPCTLAGTANITVEARDPGGLFATQIFTVTVKDNVPPFFTGAKDKVYSVAAGTSADASAHFAGIAAADKVDGPISHTCTLAGGGALPAGNLFPVGVHPIECTATDAALNSTTVTFNIIVLEIQTTPGVRLFDLVTLRGDAAAGTGVPAGATISVVQEAFLNNNNEIIYSSTLAGAGTNNAAVFTGTLAAQSAIAVKNTASGVGDYGNFSNLSLNDAAHAAFESRISVNPGHFLDTGGGPLASARKNAAAPTGGGELFGTLQKPALASGGELLTRANLVLGSGAGVTIGDDTLISSSAGTVLVREGDASSVATTAYDQLHPRIVASEDNNHYAFSAFLLEDAGFDPIDNTGLFTGTVGGGLPVLVARENDPAPGIAGATLKQFLGEAVNSSGELALRCNLAGTGVTSTNNEALYTNTGGSLVLVAREGDVAPCLPNNLVAFKRFETFYMGDDGSVCFRAFLKNATTTPAIHSGNDGSVWRWKDGTLHLVAREGDMANNTDGAVIRTIDGFSCSGAGGITYWTSFVPGLGDSVTSNNLGAYLDRGVADAAPELILRRSDTFDLGGGDIRTVVGIKLSTEENSGGGTGGYGRTINDAGNVLLNLRLSGNQSGIFVLSP